MVNKLTDNNIDDHIYEEEFELYGNQKTNENRDFDKSALSKSSIKSNKNPDNNFSKNKDKSMNNFPSKLLDSDFKEKETNNAKENNQNNISNINLDKDYQNNSISSKNSIKEQILDKKINNSAKLVKNLNKSNPMNDSKNASEIFNDDSFTDSNTNNKNNNQVSNNNKFNIKKIEENNNINDSLDLSHIRLNKSCEATYIRQNMDQFDIEYMCRCLGMALMKHIESSKEKVHVMELVDNKEEFSFFNSIFNKNINFLLTFFNLENQIQQISNLDKLDYYEKMKKEEDADKNDLNIGSDKKTKEKKESVQNLPNTISYLTHIKDPKDKDDESSSSLNGASSMNEYDKEYVLSKIKKEEIEKEINTIHEFFKNSAKSSKYKNVSENTKNIMNEELNSIHEVDSIEYCRVNKLLTGEMKDKETKNNEYINLLRESIQNLFNQGESENNENLGIINENNNLGVNEEELEEDIINYDDFDKNILEANSQKNEESDIKEDNDKYKDKEKKEYESKIDQEFHTTKNKFTNYNIDVKKDENKNIYDHDLSNDEEEFEKMPETPYLLENDNQNAIDEDIKEKDEFFESGLMESNYIIDVANAEKLKNFILKTSEVYDDDYDYLAAKILHKRFVQTPDPLAIFEFAANIMILTKMEKEVIIISLIYLERFIFNTGVLINSRNWKRILFTGLIVASKIWDDDSFENNHFAQVFTHLKIGEINLLERTFLELINYKVYVKCSEYFKYFFIVKSIALKYNFNGFYLVPISVDRMMKVQEYAYLAQKKFKKKYSCNNSAEF